MPDPRSILQFCCLTLFSLLALEPEWVLGEFPVPDKRFDFLTTIDARSQSRLLPLQDSSIGWTGPSLVSGDRKEIAKQVYVWGWPMVYLHNIQKPLKMIKRPGISGGAPIAPINQISMLTDYVPASLRSIPCPNRDVLYGFGILDLSQGPVVVQVPNFKDRFWIYQLGDHRTESFAELGSMYGSPAGFYLVTGPQWNGPWPVGFQQVFRSPTNLAYILPRIYVEDSEEDKRKVSESLSEISVYPFARFDGEPKTHNWRKNSWYPSLGQSTRETCKWVRPESFFKDLKEVLRNLAPTEGEETIFSAALQLVQDADASSEVAAQFIEWGPEFEESLIQPLFDFRSFGKKLPGNWRTIENGAAFGDDHLTRTAVAKSNIFVNRQKEAKYYYLDMTSNGKELRGDGEYTITFSANQLPPNDGFWSLTLYDENHSLYENDWQRYSFGSKSKNLKFSEDGSLTIRIRQEPTSDVDGDNWLPCPSTRFTLYLRIYAPSTSVLDGTWTPPQVFEKYGQDVRQLATSMRRD